MNEEVIKKVSQKIDLKEYQIKNVVTYILTAIVLSKISFSLTFILLLGK